MILRFMFYHDVYASGSSYIVRRRGERQRDWRPLRADDSIPPTDQLANGNQSDVRGRGAQLLLQHGGAAFDQERAR